MSATEDALRKSLPQMDDAAPMSQGVEAEGLLAEATRQVSFYVQKLAEQVPALMRSGHDSKRRALLKAIDILTSEFPPPADSSQQVPDQVAKAATGQAPNPGAAMLQGATQQPQPGAGNGQPNQSPVQA